MARVASFTSQVAGSSPATPIDAGVAQLGRAGPL